MQLMIENIMILFFSHEIRVKMYHFQTNSYGSHKASDSYLDGFRDNADKFMETLQGKYEKIASTKIKFDVAMLNDANFASEIDGFVESFNAICSSITDTGLLAIRDEMIANATQLKYLLTFK